MKNISFFLNNKLGGDCITFHYRYRKQIIFGAIVFIFVTLLSIYYVININRNEKDIIEEKEPLKKSNDKDKETEKIYVDIKGEVNSPGIYLMPTNSRVIDVIERAGGLTTNANTSVINLSKKIIDEMVIIVYSNEQVNNFYETKEIEKEVLEKCIMPDTSSLQNDACIITDHQSSNKININIATKDVLMTLPGIGESKAKDIITYRETNGLFKSIEDIKKVNGIGENIYSQIKEIITV